MSAINESPVITRFAPSPTGSLHLGNARTAHFSHLWARKTGGKFILRIEDTDAERSQDRFRDQLMADMRWLGLDWDEGPDVGGPSGPYRQAERGDFYRALYEQLTTGGRAYPCYCTPEDLELSRKLQRMSGKPPRYAGTCRGLSAAQRAEREARGLKPTLRFAVPADQSVEFIDAVHGAQRFATNDIGDFIIRREDGTPAFFFCNAVDDSAMGVTQVLRGDDHLTNTPRQIMLLDALGMRSPAYGHLGLLVGEDGAPLSKRHGSTSVHEFRERGFLSIAVLNHLFRLGHASDIDGWLPAAEMPRHFRPQHLGRAPARFEVSQLMHWQKVSLEHLSAPEFKDWLAADDSIEFIDLVRHNVILPADAIAWRAVVNGELGPLGAEEQRIAAAAGADFFAAAALAYDQSHGDLKLMTQQLKARTGRKGPDLFMPLRVALTGTAHGPELALLMKLMSADTVKRRLQMHAQNP
ncbi:MAG TPA: glutamate--tRNA ligase [Steroidobacteraceae bacterium]|nr:glutamate--tRNA ligase [Steroidobacteraceae bacterium]